MRNTKKKMLINFAVAFTAHRKEAKSCE